VPLDPESQALIETTLAAERARPGMSAAELRAQALRLGRDLQGEPPALARVWDEIIDSDGHPLKLRVYDPRVDAGAGCLVWLHGGGFTTGSLDTHDTLCRRLAALSAQVVVSVDYRLAPEHPFPAALNDSCAALEWAAQNGSRLGASSGRIAVGGSSAGGNLAAAASIVLRDRGGPTIVLQALVYPALDATMALSGTSVHGSGFQLTTAMMRGYWANYIGRHGDPRDPRLSPIFARDLSGVPPAYVVTAEFDPLVHEIEAFATRLQAGGRLAALVRYEGVMHGFFAQAGRLSKAREAQASLCASVRRTVSSAASGVHA
jgi:acetyl esterase